MSESHGGRKAGTPEALWGVAMKFSMRKAAGRTAMVVVMITGGLVLGALSPAYSQNDDAPTTYAQR
jgi:hypothetical protein